MTLTAVSLRELSVEERHTLEQLAPSRANGSGISLSAHGGPRVGLIRARSAGSVVARCELRRFACRFAMVVSAPPSAPDEPPPLARRPGTSSIK